MGSKIATRVPPGLECWNTSMMREAAGVVPLLKEKMLTPSFATEG